MQKINEEARIRQVMEETRFQSNFSFDITPYAGLCRFEASEHIMREGSQARELFYMVKGRAKLYLTHSNGKISLIDFYKAPCFFGELELLGIQPETTAVQAISGCDCLVLPFSTCKDRLLGDALFLKNLCKFVGTKSLANTRASTRQQAFPLENRFASFIIVTSQNSVYSEKHTEAAEYLGVSYRHLLYVLAEFVKCGVLKKEPGGYRIIERKQLEELAQQMI